MSKGRRPAVILSAASTVKSTTKKVLLRLTSSCSAGESSMLWWSMASTTTLACGEQPVWWRRSASGVVMRGRAASSGRLRRAQEKQGGLSLLGNDSAERTRQHRRACMRSTGHDGSQNGDSVGLPVDEPARCLEERGLGFEGRPFCPQSAAPRGSQPSSPRRGPAPPAAPPAFGASAPPPAPALASLCRTACRREGGQGNRGSGPQRQGSGEYARDARQQPHDCVACAIASAHR